MRLLPTAAVAIIAVAAAWVGPRTAAIGQTVSSGVTPESNGAAGDGRVDDRGALAAAADAASGQHATLVLTKRYRIGSDLTVGTNVAFGPDGQLSPDPGAHVMLAGNVEAATDQQIFSGGGSVAATKARWVSVAWWGANAAAADAAPAIRSALGSDRTIFFPPTTYHLASTVRAPYADNDPATVLVQGLNNFTWSAIGATFQVTDAIAFSAIAQFDQDTHFEVVGGVYKGSRAGLAASQENNGMMLTNDIDFQVTGVTIGPGYGGLGAAFAGDYLIDGLISHTKLDGVGICTDFAFLHGVTLRHIVAVGADATGQSTPGHPGNKCVSNVYDKPSLNFNRTGQPFDDTDSVTVSDLKASNFNICFALGSGRRYTFRDNRCEGNSGNPKAIGYYIYYQNTGNFSSAGHPVGDVSIDGDVISNKGARDGYGVLVASGAIKNSDVISNISVSRTTFDDNPSGGAEVDSATGVSGIRLTGNHYLGAARDKPVGRNLKAMLSPGSDSQ